MVVLLGLALPRLSAPQGFILTLVIIGAYTACNYLLFSRLDLQLELFYPLLAVGLSYVGISVQRLLTEERERLRIRKAFESYVAPAVVQEMLKHPEQLRLGGSAGRSPFCSLTFGALPPCRKSWIRNPWCGCCTTF